MFWSHNLFCFVVLCESKSLMADKFPSQVDNYVDIVSISCHLLMIEALSISSRDVEMLSTKLSPYEGNPPAISGFPSQRAKNVSIRYILAWTSSCQKQWNIRTIFSGVEILSLTKIQCVYCGICIVRIVTLKGRIIPSECLLLTWIFVICSFLHFTSAV